MTKYVVLLHTRCGCTRFIECGTIRPYPLFEVMLTPKATFAQYDLFKDVDVTTEGPRRRQFREVGSKWADERSTMLVIEYEEVPE